MAKVMDIVTHVKVMIEEHPSLPIVKTLRKREAVALESRAPTSHVLRVEVAPQLHI